MTLSIIPVDANGINNIADGLTGFIDETKELQQLMMTILFISGASEASNGRCSYLLLDDGARMWVPNSLRCWLVDLSIKTQQYESYDPVEKLLIRVLLQTARPMCIAADLIAGQPQASSASSST